MGRNAQKMVVGGFAALALMMSATGPCHCLIGAAECHREASEPDTHGCCDRPAGVQAVADECCDDGPEMVMATTGVPEVAPPTLQASPIGTALPGERTTPAAAVRTPPPVSLERTTVLLI